MSEYGDTEARLSLAEAGQQLLDECRMVLPGMQALFGFQLIVVFNEKFSSGLEPVDQYLHLCAIAFIAVAIALVMTPASYHRQMGIGLITKRFLGLSSRLLLASMLPLALGIALDFFLIAKLITRRPLLSLASTAALLGFYAALWVGLPRVCRRRYLNNRS